MKKAKPFPWSCVNCGTKTVQPVTEEYVAQVAHDGKTYSVCVPAAVIPTCSRCARKVLTESVNGKIDAALREQLKLLTPDQIRTNIEALSLTQKEVACHLGIAQETLSRWVTGAMIQTKSNDRFLRIFFGIPIVRQRLKEPMDPNLGRSIVVTAVV